MGPSLRNLGKSHRIVKHDGMSIQLADMKAHWFAYIAAAPPVFLTPKGQFARDGVARESTASAQSAQSAQIDAAHRVPKSTIDIEKVNVQGIGALKGGWEDGTKQAAANRAGVNKQRKARYAGEKAHRHPSSSTCHQRPARRHVPAGPHAGSADHAHTALCKWASE